jgi:hypothetical protein
MQGGWKRQEAGGFEALIDMAAASSSWPGTLEVCPLRTPRLSFFFFLCDMSQGLKWS